VACGLDDFCEAPMGRCGRYALAPTGGKLLPKASGKDNPAMRVVLIGGKGHVGTYLIPRLVEAGHTVINVSRGERQPYQSHPAWQEVRQVTLDRGACEADGIFGERIAALEPEAVIDMICFTLDSAKQLTEALRGKVQHLLHCGTIWTHGHTFAAPTPEDAAAPALWRIWQPKGKDRSLSARRSTARGFPATAVCTPVTLLVPVGIRSILPGISIRSVFAHWRAAMNWRCPTLAWKRCITSTPTTWRSRLCRR
jgi:hypothetical protein